jgi:hypothetical protein
MKLSNSARKSESAPNRAKRSAPVQRDTKEVLAELVEKLKERLGQRQWLQSKEKRIHAEDFAPISTV